MRECPDERMAIEKEKGVASAMMTRIRTRRRMKKKEEVRGATGAGRC